MINNSSAQNLKQVTDSKELALLCAKSALDKKSENIKIYDVNEASAYADFLVLMDGSNERQVSAIADAVSKSARDKFQIYPIGTEGLDVSQWVLIDFGAVVIHVFQPHIREMYDLDSLWQSAARVEVPADYYTSPQGSELN